MQHKDEDYELFYEIEKYLKKHGNENFDQNAMNSIMEKALRVNFIGWPAKDDFFLFQWIKDLSVDPNLLVMHAVYLDDSDSIVLHTALTGIIPFDSFSLDSCLAYNPRRISQSAEIVSAKKVFLLINHPHGYIAPSKQARSLAVSARKHLGDLFGGVIISGPFFYTYVNSYGNKEASKLSIGDTSVDKAHIAFRNILDTDESLSIYLGLNKDQRIVFWAFNHIDYPNHLYNRIIEVLDGVEEHIFISDPDRIMKMGESASILCLKEPSPDYSFLTEVLDKELVPVVFHSVAEDEGKKILKYFFINGNDVLEAPLRNPEVLCGHLMNGSEINIIRYRNHEVALHLTEEDLIPADMIPYLKHFMPPAYRTYIGAITEPENNRGFYCTFLNSNSGYHTVCFGEYEVQENKGYCFYPSREWKMRYGVMEDYFFYREWRRCPITHWTFESPRQSDTIDSLTKDKLNKEYRFYLQNRPYYEYFFSDDWSPEFYRMQARLGFIAITDASGSETRLVPQLQQEYSVLDWDDLVIDSSVKKIIKKQKDGSIRLHIENNPESVLENLLNVWKDGTWLSPEYIQLMKKFALMEERDKDKRFALWGVSLIAGPEQISIAGEFGYTIGKTYTSLSGFFRRDLKGYNNYGKLQMVILAKVLQENGIEFWNLGHPYMQYKTDLGAHIESRNDFLKRWDEAVDFESPDISGYREIQKNLELKEQVKYPGARWDAEYIL